jgi:hypothetical protein
MRKAHWPTRSYQFVLTSDPARSGACSLQKREEKKETHNLFRSKAILALVVLQFLVESVYFVENLRSCGHMYASAQCSSVTLVPSSVQIELAVHACAQQQCSSRFVRALGAATANQERISFHLISVRNVYDYDGIIGGYVVVARTRPGRLKMTCCPPPASVSVLLYMLDNDSLILSSL